jgi:hypothetical protein
MATRTKVICGRLVRRVLFAACRILQARAGEQPVPVARIRRLRSLAPVTNALAARRGEGRWTLDPEAFELVAGEIERLRPAWILEFGSGESTVQLATLMGELGAPDGTVVHSIEQDPQFAKQTERLLQERGVRHRVRLEWRSLRQQHVAGRPTVCYDLSPAFVRDFVPGSSGFVLVDGPAGDGDVRFGTLPLIQPALHQATPFVLDDALRDDELRVAQAWAKLDGFAVHGIRVVGEGLLTGTVGPVAGAS